MNAHKALLAAALAPALLLMPSCRATGSLLGATIAELQDPFVVLDLTFET
jgi:hypothetical protein